MSAKADKFLKMLEKWDKAGGGDDTVHESH